MNNLLKAAIRHQQSQAHIRTEISLKTFVTSRIEFQLDQQRKKKDIINHNELVKHNRKVIVRLIDVVIELANEELPLRGQAEDKNSENWGNYVELVSLLGKYDNIMGRHLQAATVFSGLSNHIKNYIID